MTDDWAQLILVGLLLAPIVIFMWGLVIYFAVMMYKELRYGR